MCTQVALDTFCYLLQTTEPVIWLLIMSYMNLAQYCSKGNTWPCPREFGKPKRAKSLTFMLYTAFRSLFWPLDISLKITDWNLTILSQVRTLSKTLQLQSFILVIICFTRYSYYHDSLYNWYSLWYVHKFARK